jgi:hypothetical protein
MDNSSLAASTPNSGLNVYAIRLASIYYLKIVGAFALGVGRCQLTVFNQA